MQAEKTQACRKMLHRSFPQACLTSDVFNMLETIPSDKKWKMGRLKIASTVPCETHDQRLGNLGRIVSSVCCSCLCQVLARYRPRCCVYLGSSLRLFLPVTQLTRMWSWSIDNFETKKLHDVGCAVMQTVNLAIHENVKEYQEDCSEIHEVRPKCLLESADARIRI